MNSDFKGIFRYRTLILVNNGYSPPDKSLSKEMQSLHEDKEINPEKSVSEVLVKFPLNPDPAILKSGSETSS